MEPTPAAILVVWVLLDWWLIKETPEDAGFPYLDTHDASSGHMHEEYSTMDLLKKVFLSPLMLMLGGVELTPIYGVRGAEQEFISRLIKQL